MSSPTNGGHSANPASLEDLDWFMDSKVFDAISDDAKRHLFEIIVPRNVNVGERFISRGDDGDVFYIIRDGRCLVNVEKDALTYPVDRLAPGDIVGEMAVLTGEKRTAHVDAETDMTLWAISRDSFETMYEEYPELKKLLTNVLIKRFSRALLRRDLSIGKYFVRNALAQGSSSVVYEGTHATLGTRVAVKMLRHDVAMEPLFVEHFRDTAKAIASLNHENIVKVYDVEHLYKTFFIIMEYVDGRSLESVLMTSDRPQKPKLLDYLLQVCAGLMHAHDKGVVHTVIKPGNILVRDDDRVKIVDLGRACAPGRSGTAPAGTGSHLSPEQITLNAVDERSDVYSLGIMAYQMFVRPDLLGDNDSHERIRQQLEQDRDDPESALSNLPEELNRCIIRATRRDPAARYANVRQIVYELQPLADRVGLTTLPGLTSSLNMMTLNLFYRDEHRTLMHGLIEDFSRELEKLGVRLRSSNHDEIQK